MFFIFKKENSEYIFKDSFPKTKMAKTDYRKLQEELTSKKD